MNQRVGSKSDVHTHCIVCRLYGLHFGLMLMIGYIVDLAVDFPHHVVEHLALHEDAIEKLLEVSGWWAGHLCIYRYDIRCFGIDDISQSSLVQGWFSGSAVC